MKGNKFALAVFKSLLCMAAIFLIGYLGYSFPDLMIWVIAFGICCAFTWYFYIKDNPEN